MSIWKKYAWQISALLALLLIQSLLIISFWFQKRRKEQAEESLRQMNETLEQRVQKRADELMESETRYRALFNSMTEGFALHEIIRDEEGKPCDLRFLEVNPAFERLTGLTRSDLIGNRLTQVLPGVETRRIEEYGRVGLTGEPLQVEYFSPDLNRWYRIYAYRTFQDRIAVVFNDITERKESEAALREIQKENEFLADLIHRSSQPFAVGYPDGRLGLHNKAFEQLTGYRSEELNKVSWSQVLTPPEWLEREKEKLEELHRTGIPLRYEKEYIRKDGTRVPLEVLVHLYEMTRENLFTILPFSPTSPNVKERKRNFETVKQYCAKFLTAA